MATDWIIEAGHYGPRLVMRGPWSSAALAAARSRGVRELELNHAKGWRGRDVSFLKDLADSLASFTIIDFAIENVEAVNSLSGLQYLDVNTYCKTEIRFSEFPQLVECALEWRPKARSLFQHRGVKRLFINKWNEGKDLMRCSAMTQLESLRLYSPTRLESLSGIETLTALTWLELALASNLTSLVGIETLTKLRHVELHTCRKIRDISPVGHLHTLKEFFLPNCGDVETLRPLRSLQDLEVFLFYESTNVLDGDLTVLKALPKLEDVTFMDRSHYSHRRSEFPQRPPRPTNS